MQKKTTNATQKQALSIEYEMKAKVTEYWTAEPTRTPLQTLQAS